MRKDAEPVSASGTRAFSACFALLATALACSIVVIAAPRPVYPSQLPPLRLAAGQVATELARERALATRVERSPDVDRLLVLYGEEGRAELERNANVARMGERRAELRALARDVFARLGPNGTRALIARTQQAALLALHNRDQSEHARGLLGNFPQLLARYGYIDADGGLRAPELALRAFYKARFNVICERPLAADLSPIEVQAYQGWNALHAAGLAPERRALAARAFYEAGGAYGAEALAIWLFQGGARNEAGALLQREYERTGALRLRNMALFALRADTSRP